MPLCHQETSQCPRTQKILGGLRSSPDSGRRAPLPAPHQMRGGASAHLALAQVNGRMSIAGYSRKHQTSRGCSSSLRRCTSISRLVWALSYKSPWMEMSCSPGEAQVRPTRQDISQAAVLARHIGHTQVQFGQSPVPSGHQCAWAGGRVHILLVPRLWGWMMGANGNSFKANRAAPISAMPTRSLRPLSVAASMFPSLQPLGPWTKIQL